jgi:hypothetical protein
MTTSSVLHVVVGRGLPVHFLNCVDSVLELTPDPLLVIDNASTEKALLDGLQMRSRSCSRLRLLTRSSNDVATNSKVGGLYEAYRLAFTQALSEPYEFVHVLQSDMQMLWWDAEVLDEGRILLEAHPNSVNVYTCALSRDKSLTAEIVQDGATHRLRKYGVTDTGLYDLERWQRFGMRFGDSEEAHSRLALDKGLIVPLHPTPTDVQVPWPPVIRDGRTKGREVSLVGAMLVKPLSSEQVGDLRRRDAPAPLEDICVPWGWTTLSPMWITDLDRIDYWVLRYKALRRDGLRAAIPRYERRGIDRGILGWLKAQRRPQLYSFPWKSLRALARFVASRIRGRTPA